MAKIRVADYITDYLYKKFDVKHIFMLSGGGSIYLDDSVALHPNVKDICVRNEATAAMMANGYVKSGARLGVAYVTTGPGSANAISGLVESWVDSCPVLIVSGQVNSYQTIHAKKQSGMPYVRSYGTQELNILSIVEPITKKCLRLCNPNDVREYLDDLIYTAMRDRKGPVWLEVPLDVQSAYVDDDWPYIDIHDLITEKIKNSKKPLILAGQGIKNSNLNLPETGLIKFKELLEYTEIPVIFSRMGLDSIPYEYKYNLGIGGIKGRKYNNVLMKEADLILAIGTTLSPAFVGHDLEFLGDNIIIVDIDESELNKFNNVNKNITKLKVESHFFCHTLLENLKETEKIEISEWHDIVLKTKEKNKIEYRQTTPIDVYDLVKTIDELTIDTDIICSDAGSSYYVTQQTLEFNKGQKDLTSGAYASMGVAIPLSIGAALQNPYSKVIVIVGDGSMETNIQELKTVSYYGLNIKIFVINNGGYISMRDHQDKLFNGRYINATEETGNPVLNFCDVAKAFGLSYLKIDEYETMRYEIEYALSINGPLLIEVICDSNQKLTNPISSGEKHGWMA